VRSGGQTFIWEDVWLGGTPLKIKFPDLYKFSDDPMALVADCGSTYDWEVGFRRTLTVNEMEQRDALFATLQGVSLDPMGRDEVSWAFEKSKNFTTKSLYRFIIHRGVRLDNSKNIWKTKLPLKIKVFLWQVANNRLQTATELTKRAWKGGSKCCLCGRREDKDHIFFKCSLAQFVWCCVRDVFRLSRSPMSWDDFQGGWLSQSFKMSYRTGLFVFAGLAWAMWRNRNKMAIEQKFPSNPVDVIRSGMFFVQKWLLLLKDAEHKTVAAVLKKLQDFLELYRMHEATAPDIVIL
jgi:hypothetical protein